MKESCFLVPSILLTCCLPLSKPLKPRCPHLGSPSCAIAYMLGERTRTFRTFPTAVFGTPSLGVFPPAVLASRGCWSKSPRPWGLKTQMHSFQVLEATSLKPRCWQGHAPSGGSRRRILPCFLLHSGGCQQSLELLGLWQWDSSLCLCRHTDSRLEFLLCRSSRGLHIRTPVVELRAHPDPV